MAILVLAQGLAHEYPFAAARNDREHAGDSRTCRRAPSPSAVSAATLQILDKDPDNKGAKPKKRKAG